MTGWNLPPGCTVRMIEDAMGGDGPCECCGNAVDNCICPECPYCGEQGNPHCYSEGHESDDVRLAGKLEYSRPQLIGQTQLKIAELKDRIADHEQYIAHLESEMWGEEYAKWKARFDRS